MKRSLLVLGCGGHGRVVADAARACGYDEIGFLDDAPIHQHSKDGILVGPISMIEQASREWTDAIVAIGDCATRVDLFERLLECGFNTPNIVHPFSAISRGAQMGRGIFVAAGAVINVGAQIEDAVIVNTGARIDHDCRIGMGSHVSPGASLSGGVRVGTRAWLGTGCSVRQGVAIGDSTIVGVGAAVISDIPSGMTYVGVPARALRTHDKDDRRA